MSYILSSQGIRINQEPASFAARLFAFAIDCTLVAVVMYFLIKLYNANVFYGINEKLVTFLMALIPQLYFLCCETMGNGQTVGKRLLNIRVVSLDGGGLKMTSLILRCLMLPFDLFLSAGIGPLCIFFTKRQQRLGDLVAGTWVVRTQIYEKVSFDSLSDEE